MAPNAELAEKDHLYMDHHASTTAIPKWPEDMLVVAGKAFVKRVEADLIKFFLQRIDIQDRDLSGDRVITADR